MCMDSSKDAAGRQGAGDSYQLQTAVRGHRGTQLEAAIEDRWVQPVAVRPTGGRRHIAKCGWEGTPWHSGVWQNRVRQRLWLHRHGREIGLLTVVVAVWDCGKRVRGAEVQRADRGGCGHNIKASGCHLDSET